jgi:hypothetical protein
VPKKRIFILLLASHLILCSTLLGISPYAPKGKGLVGPKIGILGRANIEAGDETFTSKINVSLGLFFDVSVAGRLYSGVAVDFHNIEVLDQQQFFLDISIPLKFSIPFDHPGIIVKPVVAVGWGHLAGITFMKATNYLTLKASVELHYLMPKKRAWVFELGVFDAPVGGNSHTDSSVGLAPLFRVGYVL